VPQRAKVEDYDDHMLVVLRAPLQPFGPTDRVPQVCLLLAGNYIVTFQERYFAFFDGVRARVRDEHSTLRRSDPALLAYALSDALIDQYYPVVDEISDELDEIEGQILDDPAPHLVARVQQLQRAVTTLRRVARPQVEALYKLAHADSRLVPDATSIFLKDVEDRARQILGRLDASREIATDLMSAVLATLGHRQNEIMKVLTLVGSIFIPLTFMAGIYGMNFEYMPELGVRAGYPILLVAMVIVAVAMVFLFKSRGWIGGGRSRDD
jgi:magnesium transporter